MKRRQLYYHAIPVMFMLVPFLRAQTEVVAAPPAMLVTIPTSGTLQRGQYELEVLMQRGGSLLTRLGVGFSDRFSLGMSYGIQHFIGDEKPALNRKMPEAQLKYRFFDETYRFPALALGLDSQGRGAFHSDTVSADLVLERYDIKALGAFMVASKNWQVMGNLGAHLGICKNFWEQDSLDSDFNLFLGVDKEINPSISVFLEYNAAFDDNQYSLEDVEDLTFGKGRGYLNAGIRVNVAPGLFMEVDFNDILVNKGDVEYFSRELKVSYNEFF